MYKSIRNSVAVLGDANSLPGQQIGDNVAPDPSGNRATFPFKLPALLEHSPFS